MPPRLVQGSHRPRTTASGSASSASRRDPAELPPYEPPAYPMNDAAKRALAEISKNRETRRYEQHLVKSAGYLRDSVGTINDILFLRRSHLALVVERRQALGVTEKTEWEVEEEEYTARMESVVATLTDESEAAMREVIDRRAELEDERQVLAVVQEQISAQKPRREPQHRGRKRKGPKRPPVDSDGEDVDDEEHDGAAEDDDEDMPDREDETPLTGVRELLKSARESKADEYNALSAHERYGLNNDYISFKKTWHDAVHPEDQVPLPDASTWFDALGRPTTGAAADGDDDDLMIEREIIDLKCPLSLQTMKEPYSNHKCKHTFEKSAILDFLRTNGGTAQCPVCSKELQVKDLYLDDLILRKIKRAEQARRRDVDDTSDIEVNDAGDLLTAR
ncbi:zinc-finger of the MIZ type in Nse subunit-domain-containing protein [Bombardia bombarda]|uniref:peptidylprolyl isomerase n=1 Tax=Bombardia bombarda TaxID=252184 RepID=A0AA39X9C2_9PEZI|nr:zinc-finger of the MIZ type in Nse subunit-domain-containing protein [Bombardia bombarda]